MNVTSSDRKKLLSLPFFMNKRQELPEPKKGQSEWALFEEIFNKPYDWDKDHKIDKEDKITEFNYEKYIHEDVLAQMDTDSDEFKELIRALNFSSNTEYQQHQKDKQKFREMMPLLSELNAKEQRDLIHMLDSESVDGQYLDSLINNDVERELAELSAAENYAQKNRYVH